MRTRLLTLCLTLLLLASLASGALAAGTIPDVDAPEVFLKQSRSSGTCTLASTAMMLRRTAILRGDEDWASITEASCRSSFWRGGLPYTFSYGDVTVGHGWLPGGAANRAYLADLLADHPEGVVILSYGAHHGVLLTDCTDGLFYCADPAPSVPCGRMPIEQAWGTRVENSAAYWYVTSPVIPPEPDPPALPLPVQPVASDIVQSVAGHMGLSSDVPAGPVRS